MTPQSKDSAFYERCRRFFWRPVFGIGVIALLLLLWPNYCLGGPRVLVFSAADNLTNVPPQATNAVMLASGLSQVGILRADGRPVLWGPGTNVLKTNLLAIALSYYDGYCRLHQDGRVFAGREESEEALGYTGVSNAVALAGDGPYLALRGDGTVAVVQNTNNPPWSNIVAIAADTSSPPPRIMGLRSDGTVVSWNDPVPVPPSLSNIVAIALGGGNHLALRSDGTVATWGNTNVPSGLTNIVAISASLWQALALKQDGTVVSWGISPELQVPPTISNVVAIVSGRETMVIVDPSPPPLLISSAGITNGSFQVTVPTISGRVYSLEHATSLPATNWTPLPLVAGNGRTRVLVDATPVAGTGQCFYRVRKW
jgi:hypothetical protein